MPLAKIQAEELEPKVEEAAKLLDMMAHPAN